jgi:phosphonoacetaldehyde hydrolase
MWTVTVCFSGNLLSLTWAEYCAFSSERLNSKRKRIDQLFIPRKLHYLIDTIADLLSTMTNIIARLIHDERPANH